MGATATWDMRTWDNGRRREVSIVVMLAALVLVVSGLVLEYVLGSTTLVLNVLVGILVLLLVVEAAVHLAKPKAQANAYADAAPAAAPPPAASDVLHLTLKCGQCATVFDVPDTGERPLYHTCPGCGAQGVLNSSGGGVSATAAPAARTPLRKLKLRCAACQTVFVIEDFGDRPLRHACPGCGRKGELK